MQLRDLFGVLSMFLLMLQCNWVHSDICQQHLKSLASRQKDFVQCSTLHSVPVRLCMACEPQYTEMTVAFITLKETPNCTDKYFDKDRINIVSTTQSILLGLWSKAYCDDCFNGSNFNTFDQKSIKLEECINEHNKTECVNCLGEYTELNSFYIRLDQHNNGKVCYDMQDSMNRTRLLWSEEFKCCRRQFKMTLFLIVVSVIGFLPILFYSGTYALTKRREANHGLLNSDPEFDANGQSTPAIIAAIQEEIQSPQAPATTTTAIIAASQEEEHQPPLPTRGQDKPKQVQHVAEDSDDDESEENIVSRKKL